MDKLEEIIAEKRMAIKHLIRPVKANELENLAKFKKRSLFREAINCPNNLSVIAEIKRKSPSAGNIAEQADAVEQARIYHNSKADALSILTEEKYFGGKLNDLFNVKEFLREHNLKTPCLRKDFMVHPIQILEAIEAGADCILIIVRALTNDEISYLKEAAYYSKMDIIYEIHTEEELEKALSFDPQIIGVNNRDLSNFETDISNSELLIPKIPQSIIRISESGIYTKSDAIRAKSCGANAVLVGEALMQADDPELLIDDFHSV